MRKIWIYKKGENDYGWILSKRSHNAPHIQIVNNIEWEDRFYTTVTEEIVYDTEERLIVLKDENDEPVLDENDNVQYIQATDENGELLYKTDENGDQVLDSNENPIPIYETEEIVIGEKLKLNVTLDSATKDAALAQRELDQAWKSLRAKRDALLAETDYIMMPDYPLADKSEIENYRSILRDLPENTTDPKNPSWPAKPQI